MTIRGVVLVAILLTEHAARAEEAPSPAPRVIEEIVVTAQKTEEHVQDVPISMTVVGSDFLAEQTISDFRDLSPFVPSAKIEPGNGVFPDVNLRGFGSALAGKTFEQSVGLAVDEIPYARAAYFQGALFDVERVEVLRGPQGTLFGKNTTAGLFNVVTAKPTDRPSGFVSAEYGELDRHRVEAAASGPVVRGFLNARIAGLFDERDGIVDNTTARVDPRANDRMNDRDRKGIRAKLDFPSLAGIRLTTSYEHVEFDFTGVGMEFDRVPEKVKPFYRLYDPNVDFDPDDWKGSVDFPEYNHNAMDTAIAKAETELGGWALAAVGGYSKLRVRSAIDVDFGPEPMENAQSRDDTPQSTFEGRAASPDFELPRGLGTVRVLAGAFWQHRDLANSVQTISLNLPVVAQFAAVNAAPQGSPVPPLLDFVGAAVPIGTFGGVFDTRALVASTPMVFSQSTQSTAGFVHTTWTGFHRWTLEYGMRFTEESKEASWDRSFSTGSDVVFAALGGSAFTAKRSRSEFAFTPKVSVRYDWSDAASLYGTWTRGYKAGGFNEQAFSTGTSALQYDPEIATAWELGAKTRLLDGAAALNAALFWENVTDLQVLTVEPSSVVTSVQNAGEARARGVEIDAQWLAARWLTFYGALSFNDTEYLSFVNGQCSFDRPDTDGNGDGRCDVTGQPFFHAPKWTTTVAGNVRYPIAWGVDLLGGLTVEYQDTQFLDRTFDSRVRQPSFFRFGGNLGLGNAGQGWSARVIVDNMTDKATDTLIRDVPLGGGNFAKIPEPPRLVFGSVRWAF